MKTRNNKKLHKYSWLFMQLGLVLALFASYVILEHKSIVNYKFGEIYKAEETADEEPRIIDYVIEKKQVKKVVKQKMISSLPPTKQNKPTEKQLTDVLRIEKNDTPSKESTFDPDSIIDSGEEDEIKKEDDPEPVKLNAVQEAPIYPGCEKGTAEEKKACFEAKVKRFVNRKFDTEIVDLNHVDKKRQRVSVLFKIDTNGEIVILKSRAKHKNLIKEAKRVVNKLPRMIPGKQDGKPVEVIYSLPITIELQ